MDADYADRVRKLPRYHWASGGFAVVSMLLSLFITDWVLLQLAFGYAALLLTWQSTVYWCAYRAHRDGIQVWEKRKHGDE